MAGLTKGSNFLMLNTWATTPTVKAPAAKGMAVVTSKETHSPQG